MVPISEAARKVKEFHETFGLTVNDEPTEPNFEDRDFRRVLLQEEAEEARRAFLEGNIEAIAKELADVLYVTYGAALTYGIDIDQVFDEVHKSNMSKVDDEGNPIYREDGKVMKGPNYQPPRLTPLIWP